MITAAAVELRAGSRLLLDAATFRVAPGDRVGLVGRNGAGKTTLTKALAGVTQPAAGTITRSGEVGYLPQDPRTGDLHITARDRVLSARGLDTIVRDLRAAEHAMAHRGRREAGPGDAPLRPARGRVHRGGRVCRGVRGRADRRRARARRAGARPGARHPLRWPAPPHRADPHPVLRRRDPAPRRADQPPRRRLDRLAARPPQGLPRRAGGHLARRRAARRGGQQGVPPRRQPRRARPVQPGLEGLPAAARDRRAAPQARAGQRREEGHGADGPGRQDAGQGHQDRRGAEHGAPGRAAALRPGGRAGPRQGGQAALPEALGVRQDAAAGERAVALLRVAGGLHRRRPRHRPRLARRRARPQRRRQDHPAADARRRRHPRHRPGRAGPRAEDRLLRPGAREPRRRPHACSRT